MRILMALVLMASVVSAETRPSASVSYSFRNAYEQPNPFDYEFKATLNVKAYSDTLDVAFSGTHERLNGELFNGVVGHVLFTFPKWTTGMDIVNDPGSDLYRSTVHATIRTTHRGAYVGVGVVMESSEPIWNDNRVMGREEAGYQRVVNERVSVSIRANHDWHPRGRQAVKFYADAAIAITDRINLVPFFVYEAVRRDGWTKRYQGKMKASISF